MPPGGASAAPPSPSGQAPPLAGAPPQQGAQNGNGSGDPSDQVKGAIQQFQDIHAQIEAMAQQFPDMAEDAKAALDSLNSGMVKVISSIQGGTEVSAPSMAA